MLSTISAQVQEDAEKICPFCVKETFTRVRRARISPCVSLNAWLTLKRNFLQMYLIIEIDHKGVSEGFSGVFCVKHFYPKWNTEKQKSLVPWLPWHSIKITLLSQNMIIFPSSVIPYQHCHYLFCPVSWQTLHSRILNPQFSFWVSPAPAILRILHLSLKRHPSSSALSNWREHSTHSTHAKDRFLGFFSPPSSLLLWISWFFSWLNTSGMPGYLGHSYHCPERDWGWSFPLLTTFLPLCLNMESSRMWRVQGWGKQLQKFWAVQVQTCKTQTRSALRPILIQPLMFNEVLSASEDMDFYIQCKK